MAITYVGLNNAIGQSAGTTTTASTTSITPTLPGSTASGDRVFVVQCASNTSATTPANWTVVGTKDTTVGSGVAASASGARRITVYYRDYDGVWTMPAFDLTSATQNSHWIGAVAIRRTSGSYNWDTPTISTVGAAYNAATTAYTDSSAASFTTHSGGFLIIGTALCSQFSSSAPALTQSGATFGTVTERCDGGTSTGNDVAGQLHTTTVTTGAAATTTFTQTLNGASQGETLIVEQTETLWAGPVFQALGTAFVNSSTATASLAVPAGTTSGDVVVCLFGQAGTSTVTASASGFTQAADSPVTGSGLKYFAYWKRLTSTDAGTYDYTLSAAGYTEGIAIRFTGCATSGDPFDVTTSGAGTGSASYPNVSDTTTVANTLLVLGNINMDGGGGAPLNTFPAGFTERLDTTGVHSVGDKQQAAAGATGTLTTVAASGVGAKAVWLGALKPPSGAAPTVIPGRATQQVPILRSSLY